MQMDGLAQVQIEPGRVGILSERGNLRDGIFRLPAIAGPPAGSGALECAGKRKRVSLGAAWMDAGKRLRQR